MTYLQIFADKAELLEPFDDAERGRLLTAMLRYALHDEEIVLTGNERYIWPVFRQMIDQSKAALHSKQEAGSKGGRAKAKQTEAEEKQTEAEASTAKQNEAEAKQTEANDPIIQESRIKIQDSRIKNQERGDKRTRFTPPSPAEVNAYAMEQGLRVDGQHFCDFYASKGWKVGAAVMKDWRAAVRTWARRDQPSGQQRAAPRVVEQQQYTQREYKHSDSAIDAMMAAYARGDSA